MTDTCVAGEGAQFAPAVHLPHLQRLVHDAETAAARPSLTATAIDPIGVAGEGAQFAPAVHLPHLQRLSSDAETRAARPPLTATPLTELSVAGEGAQFAPARPRSHTFSVLSPDAETAMLPVPAQRHAIDKQCGL